MQGALIKLKLIFLQIQYLWRKFKVLSIKSIHTELVANVILTTLNIFDKLEHRRSQDF